MATTIQLRRDIAANWTAVNPVLANGEPGVETDTGILKIGNGTDAWEDLQGISGAGGGGGMEIGTIYAHGGAAAPIGSLLCNGAAISRTEYADLFAAIGTTWGAGDGSTTFNVPDLRGAFVRGTGAHGSETMADGNAYEGPAVGAFEDDQFQGHYHRQAVNSTYSNTAGVIGGARGRLSGNAPDSGTFEAESDGTNGTPRTGDETRPFAAGVTYCIKATPATNSGTPLPTYSYSTGWVANSDWTNAEFTVTHGLNAPLSDLIVEFFISTDGTEANARQVDFHVNVDNASSATGCTGYAINDSSFKIQTGASGVDFVNETGARFNVNTESYYYKVKVYRPEVLATELAVTKYDSGWQAIPSAGNSATVTHNLGAARDDLIIEAQVRDAGGTNVSDFVDYFSNTTSDLFGEIIKPNDANSVIVQTLEGGPRGISGSGGSFVAAEYRLTIYNPNLLENVQPAAVKSVSEDYTITGRTDSHIIQVTTGAVNRTITLPAGTGMIPGDKFEINKVDLGVGNVVIERAGSDVIDGVTSVRLYSQRNKVIVRWTGSEWTVVELQSNLRVADSATEGSRNYILHADGSMKASGRRTVDNGSATQFTLATFDISYVGDVPRIVVSHDAGEPQMRIANATNVTLTGAMIRINTAVGATGSQLHWQAEGRWRA